MSPLRVAVTLVLLVACAIADDGMVGVLVDEDNVGAVDSASALAGPVDSGMPFESDMEAGPAGEEDEAPDEQNAETPEAAEVAAPEQNVETPVVKGPMADATLKKEPAIVPLSKESEPADQDELNARESQSTLDTMDPAKDVSLVGRPTSKLDRVMASRKRERLQRDAEEARIRELRARAAAGVDGKRVADTEKVLADLKGKKESITKAKVEATAEAKQIEQKIDALHEKEHTAATALATARRAEEEAVAMRDAAAVQEELQAAEAGAGGGDEDDDDEHSKTRREFMNAEYQSSINRTQEAIADVATKTKDVEALKAQVQAVEIERTSLNDQLYDADHKMAGATYDLEELARDTAHAKERHAQAEAVAKQGNFNAEVAAKDAAAAASAKVDHEDGKEVVAEAMDPQLRRQSALKKVMDQDGYSDDGTELVAKKGAVSAEYQRLWHEIKMPSHDNPLLNAAAAAASRDPPL